MKEGGLHRCNPSKVRKETKECLKIIEKTKTAVLRSLEQEKHQEQKEEKQIQWQLAASLWTLYELLCKHYICPRVHNVAIAVERIEDVSHRGHLDLSDISTTDTVTCSL